MLREEKLESGKRTVPTRGGLLQDSVGEEISAPPILTCSAKGACFKTRATS